MRAHERRQRPRLPLDPIVAERQAVVEVLKAGSASGDERLRSVLTAYAARARALRVEVDALVAEFRSVFDRSVPRNPADFRHSLRRERLVTQLVGAFRTTASG